MATVESRSSSCPASSSTSTSSPFSLRIRSPPHTSPCPPPSLSSASSVTSSISAANPSPICPNPLTWFPLSSPPSPELPSALQLVQRLFEERSKIELTAPSERYVTVTRIFHDISIATYCTIMHEFFAKDTRPCGARIDYYTDRRLIIITLPGLPHELMTNFVSDMQQSLIAQGFLWPDWAPVWLGSSGATTISLMHRNQKRTLQPDGGLQVLCQKLPFLIVEVADSQDYTQVLEKVSWVLESSRGKIRFAIVIKLVNRTTKQMREEEEQRGSGRAPVKRVLDELDSSPPRIVPKRVRTDESGSVFGSPRSNGGHGAEVDQYEAEADVDVEELSQESSSGLNSVSSVASTDPTPSSNLPIYPIATPAAPATPSPAYHHAIIAPSAPSSPSAPLTSPHLPSTNPHNPRATLSRAHVTVLSSILSGTHRKATVVLDSIEFWPTPPRAQDTFSFGWDEMPTPQYPDLMRGRRYVLDFMWLHSTLDVFVKTADPEWIRAHSEMVMDEWEEELSSGAVKGETEEEDEEEEEEVEGGEGGSGDSDADYRE